MKELIEKYRLEIEAWHLFYESFDHYEDSLWIVRGVAVEMQSELTKFFKSNPNSTKIKESQKRIDTLFSCMDNIEGITNRMIKMRSQLVKNKEMYFDLEKENELLKQELNAIKKAHEQT